jgi:hypothetical protein
MEEFMMSRLIHNLASTIPIFVMVFPHFSEGVQAKSSTGGNQTNGASAVAAQ